MTEIWKDSNGGYKGDNFKKNSENNHNTSDMAGGDEESNQQNLKANEYVKELLAEKLLMDQSKLPHAAKLIEQEVAKVQQQGRIPLRDSKYVDIYREKPIKVTVKVLVPVKEHPKFNFVGKLLGPKGNSMKRLQDETMCKMAVLGRGSMKDRNKEEELRTSLDPKYSHLADDLHVEISALGPPAEAHARVAFALAEVRKYLIPDNNDFIRVEQMREMEVIGVDPHQHPHHEEREMRPRRPPPPMIRAPPQRAPPPPMRPMPPVGRASVAAPRVMPAKTKIMSILDRARVAMEESYGYEEEAESYGGGAPPYEGYAPPRGDGYAPRSAGYGGGGGGGHQYEEPEYEGGDYYRQGGGSYEAPAPARTWKTSYNKGPSGPGAPRHAGHAGGHADQSRYRATPYTRPTK